MQVNVNFVFNSTEELASSAAYASVIKIYQVEAAATSDDGPLDDFALPAQIAWTAAGPATLPSFSATCWFSAKSVVDGRTGADREVALGLIAAPWGGTAIKAHAPISVNDTCGEFYPFSGGKPAGDCGADHAPCNASTIYNSMIYPIHGPAGFPVSSMTWFQGENDCSVAELACASSGGVLRAGVARLLLASSWGV